MALELPKFSKKSSLKGVWGELEPKNCFQRQTFIKYLRLTLENLVKYQKTSKYYENDAKSRNNSLAHDIKLHWILHLSFKT